MNRDFNVHLKMVLEGNDILAQVYENDEMVDGSVSNNFVDIRGATPRMNPNLTSSREKSLDNRV